MLMIIFYITGCNKTPKEEDLVKYPELGIFLIGRNTFRGEICDLDSGYLSFYFKTSIKNSAIFFENVDQLAGENGWTTIEIDDAYRKYRKNLKRFPAQTDADLVSLKYNHSENEYHLIWE